MSHHSQSSGSQLLSRPFDVLILTLPASSVYNSSTDHIMHVRLGLYIESERAFTADGTGNASLASAAVVETTCLVNYLGQP